MESYGGSRDEYHSWPHLTGHSVYYNNQINHDGIFVGIDPSLIIRNDELYDAEPPMPPTFLANHVELQRFAQTWDFLDAPVRHTSPGGSHGSSLSEISNSYDSASSTDLTGHPIRYSASPVSFLRNPTLRTLDFTTTQHMTWQQETHFLAQMNYQTANPSMLASQPLPLRVADFQHPDMGMANDVEEETNTVPANSQINVQLPQEVELSEASTEAATTPENESRQGTYQAKKSIKEYITDDELYDEEEEDIAIDNDSDSDYRTGPRRRKNSRSKPKSPTHRRKSSSHSVLGDPRVAKRPTTATAIPPVQSHARRPSKVNSKIRKGPFANKPTTPINKANRVFPCTFHHFGCTAEFPNKNEWKRHVACQHLQLGFYRCDLDACNPDNVSATTNGSTSASTNRRSSSQILAKHSRSEDFKYEDDESEEIVKIYNDFNRKDLFTQHCRRMHGPSRNPALCSAKNKKGLCTPTKEDETAFEHQLEDIRARCWQVRRKAPARSNCGFCTVIFDATYFAQESAGGASDEKAWEERMEHIGKHYEKETVRKEDEEKDEDLVEWGLEVGVLTRLPDGTVWLVGVERPGEEEKVKRERGTVRVDPAEDEGRRKTRQPSRTMQNFRQGKRTGVADRQVELNDEDAYGESE